MLVLERHGGRTGDEWRVLWAGNNLADGELRWRKIHMAMRQGSVRLRDDRSGEILRLSTAPRLRTRW